jgi:hypothetical protein
VVEAGGWGVVSCWGDCGKEHEVMRCKIRYHFLQKTGDESIGCGNGALAFTMYTGKTDVRF